MKTNKDQERCALCNCRLTRHTGTYGRATLEGRSHATRHHLVAERFFGRSANRRGTQAERLFRECPWGAERQWRIFCFECHEELLHNLVLLADDIERFAQLVRLHRLDEDRKPADRSKIAGRIVLLHDVFVAGLHALAAREAPAPPPQSEK